MGIKHKFLFPVAALCALALVALSAGPAFAQTAKVAAAANWSQPKTPWGDPDLQGTWTSDDCIGTPMQRPANVGDKLYLTEEDLAKRQDQLAKQKQTDLQETVAENQ